MSHDRVKNVANAPNTRGESRHVHLQSDFTVMLTQTHLLWYLSHEILQHSFVYKMKQVWQGWYHWVCRCKLVCVFFLITKCHLIIENATRGVHVWWQRHEAVKVTFTVWGIWRCRLTITTRWEMAPPGILCKSLVKHPSVMADSLRLVGWHSVSISSVHQGIHNMSCIYGNRGGKK